MKIEKKPELMAAAEKYYLKLIPFKGGYFVKNMKTRYNVLKRGRVIWTAAEIVELLMG